MRTDSPGETPPAIVTDDAIDARLRRRGDAAHGAFSANTERALRGDIARFTGWYSREPALSINDRVDLCRPTAPADTDSLTGLAPLAPAADLCAFATVLSSM